MGFLLNLNCARCCESMGSSGTSGVCGIRARRTPLGLMRFCGRVTQGSLALLRQKHFGGQATLGFEAQSRWDWETRPFEIQQSVFRVARCE